jgi:hypothetical protein
VRTGGDLLGTNVKSPSAMPHVAPATANRHGGVTTVLATKLPFTGLALWIALLFAGSLLAGGVAMRRVSLHLR